MRSCFLLLLVGCIGDIAIPGTPGAPGPGPATKPVPEVDLGQPAVFRRLAKSELEGAWAQVVGEPVALAGAVADLSRESDNFDELSTNAAVRESYDDATVSALNDEALRVAQHAVAGVLRQTCAVQAANDACAQQLIETAAHRAFRRPTTLDERAQLLALSQTAADEAQDPSAGVAFALAAVLESPNLVYIAETLGTHRLSALDLAARMSFALTGAGPDDALLSAAENGALETTPDVVAQVDRLLALSAKPLGLYFAQVWALDTVDSLRFDATLFPQATPSLLHGYRQELELTMQALYDARAPYRSVFDTPYAYVNDELAQEYGVALPGSSTLQRVEIPPTWDRRGLLGRGAFLALNAMPSRSSPTQRGRFVLQRLLCHTIAPPPAGVNTSLDGTQGATARERLASHATNPSCAGCHASMDGLGLGIERFDALGAFRSDENGEAIDDSGLLDGQAFHGEPGLAPLLASHPRAGACAIEQLMRFASGNIEVDANTALSLSTQWEAQGGTLAQLPEVVFSSDAFRRLP